MLIITYKSFTGTEAAQACVTYATTRNDRVNGPPPALPSSDQLPQLQYSGMWSFNAHV